METFSRFTSMLLHALESREPTVDLLDSFIDHWKSITNYYVQTTDEHVPVRQTDIPWCLRQMLDILVYEEKQQAQYPGPCMEFLLHQKILETLVTLGKAQYPPGMLQQVLLFFSKLLSQVQQPLLHLTTVYIPVQLIGLCALPGSHTEKEEAQFLLVICSRAKEDQNTLRLVLTLPDQSAARTPTSDQSQSFNHSADKAVLVSQSDSSACSPVQSERSLLWVLMELSKSQKSSVSVKVLQSLLLLIQTSGELLSELTQLGELLSGRLTKVYSLMVLEDGLDPGAVQGWRHIPWSSQYSSPDSPGHMTSFFCWLDFVDHLITEAPQVFSEQVSQCVCDGWMVDVLQPQLLHMCEQVVLVSTSVLCAVVRLVRSPSLLDRLVHFLLRTEMLTETLLRHCDHVNDQISLVSLSLLDELLQKPHRDILDVLLLDFLRGRSYLSPPGQEEPQADSGEDGEDDEDDPFFTDGPAHLSPPCQSGPRTHNDIINSFLCVVPVQVRSGQLLQEGGYESYVHDAHALVTQSQALSLSWDWPVSLPPPTLPSGGDSAFSEGHMIKVLFDRLGRILEQPYDLNLQLTSVLSRLASFRHPLVNEFLLNPYIHLKPGTRTLFSVLIRVMSELMLRIQEVPQLSDRLLDTRKHLLGLDQNTRLDHLTLLRGIVVLEEFCKELAAVAFVKMPLDLDWDQDKDQDQD
ncbi:FHF complex subunit HOOK-interacting protein 2B-like isoform 2-T2 [Pholidichthys leucotaenia]